jgi:Tfp pilus assembly protein FimT
MIQFGQANVNYHSTLVGKDSGSSLVELLVVLSIMLILLTQAIPAFNSNLSGQLA